MKTKPICFEAVIAGFFIQLIQDSPKRFTVVYGRQVKKGLDYAEAALELGACLMHASALDGKLSNT